MRINNLELTDFRNYNHFFIEFDQGINILIGGNAQGKTNIIEAIYLLSVCKSFRTHINDQMIRFDHDFAKVKGNVFSNERMHQLELILSKESKKAKVDGKDILKISDYVGYLNAVVFVPDDLSLVKGSPSIRRKFLDLELSKISPIYVFYLTKYNRLLKERNQYLKLLNQRRGKYDEYLETLDEQLAKVQIKIIEKRNNFIERLSLKVKDNISVDSTTITLKDVVVSGGRVSDGGTGDITVNNASVTISKDKDASSSTSNTTNTGSNTTGNTTTSNSSTSSKNNTTGNASKNTTIKDNTVTSKNTLPKTGIEQYGIVAIVVVAIVAIFSYVLYKKTSKEVK